MRTLSRCVLPVVCLWLLTLSSASACPNCRNAKLENQEATLRLREGYFWSYVVMSSMPVASVVAIAGLLVYSRHKALRKDRA
jgi:hypothetical protein